MRRGPRSEVRPFAPVRIFVKATALYLAVLAGGATFAEWSSLIEEMRQAINEDGDTVFYAYGFWLVCFYLYEAVRWKLKKDLDEARRENQKRRKRRK